MQERGDNGSVYQLDSTTSPQHTVEEKSSTHNDDEEPHFPHPREGKFHDSWFARSLLMLFLLLSHNPISLFDMYVLYTSSDKCICDCFTRDSSVSRAEIYLHFSCTHILNIFLKLFIQRECSKILNFYKIRKKINRITGPKSSLEMLKLWQKIKQKCSDKRRRQDIYFQLACAEH